MTKRHPLLLFLIVAAAAAFVFAVQYAGRTAALAFFHTSEGYKEGTLAGSVDVTGLVREQAEKRLRQEIEKWESEVKIYVKYSDATIAVPAVLFQFDVEKTMAGIQEGTETAAAVNLKPDALQALLQEQLNENVLKHLDMKRLERDLLRHAAELDQGQTVQLLSYLNQNEAVQTVSQGSVSGVAAYYAPLQQWLQKHGTLQIPARGTVSVSELSKGLKLEDEALSMIATALYEAILPTNLQVQQRGISMTLPAYAEPGLEARIEQKRSDFIFVNPNETVYTFRFALEGDTLKASLQGLPFAYRYTINRGDVVNLAKRMIVQAVVPNREHDAVTAPRSGADGFDVKVYREVYSGNGALLQKKLLAHDFYLPLQEVQHVLIVGQVPAAVETENAAAAQESETAAENAQSTEAETVTENAQSTEAAEQTK